MKIWSIVNQKGGVGKTTSTISLAGCLSEIGKRVLLVDLDPQSSLTYYMGLDADSNSHSVFDVFEASRAGQELCETVSKAIIASRFKNISLLPSHMALATVDGNNEQQVGMGLVVKKALQCVKTDYDYALLDCPPSLGILMINALTSADRLILPTQTEFLASKGLKRMLKTVESLKTSLKPEVKTHIVPTLFDRRYKAAISAYTALRECYTETLWRGYVPVDTKFRDASEQGCPITHLAPDSRGAFAYQKLTNDLLKHD